MEKFFYKILNSLIFSCLIIVPAYADFDALGQKTNSETIINNFSDNAYIGNNGNILTENEIFKINSSDYSKTGITADGNTRLILRYQSSEEGSVKFSVPSYFSLEKLSDREKISSSTELKTVQINNKFQASAVLIAPESWPDGLNYPDDDFNITADFTSKNGNTKTENLTMNLQAPTIFLIHGTFSNSQSAFAYGVKNGFWETLSDSNLNLTGWNYDGSKSPRTIINNNNNPLAKSIIETLEKLNSQGIASTRVDVIAHSTGGLVARQFLRNDFDTGNKSNLSYSQGMIRRVILIAVPNLGSPWGNFFSESFDGIGSAWQNWEAKTVWENIAPILKLFAFQKYDASEIMKDISINSDFLSNLGYPSIPFHVILGLVKDDQDEINKLFDALERTDIIAIKNFSWLPEQFIISLQKHLSKISPIVKSLSPILRVEEFLNVFFDNNDHDLCVSEPSAIDKFPENARTSFKGLADHNHVNISKQKDVAETVLKLLKGSTDNFMILNTASDSEQSSTAEYDAAFNKFLNSYEGSLKIADENENYENYLYDDDFNLNIGRATPEYLGGEDDETPQISSVNLSAKAPNGKYSNDVYLEILNSNGEAKFFKIASADSDSFNINLWINNQDSGILEVSYLTLKNDELVSISRPNQMYIPPLMEEGIKNLIAPSQKIYLNAGDEVTLNLFTETNNGGIYNVAPPVLNIVSWDIEDPEIVKISDTGEITGLKSGSTILTASLKNNESNYSAGVNVNEYSGSLYIVSPFSSNSSIICRPLSVVKFGPSTLSVGLKYVSDV